MNLTALRYVLEVERTSSITKAAENLYMGQPNLSKAIKELEQEIGVSLFTRTAKGVRPTQKGAQFLDYARVIVSQVDELENLYKPQQTQTRLSVCVPGDDTMPQVMADVAFSLSEEAYELTYRETPASEAVNLVGEGECDFGVARCQSLYRDYFMGRLADKNLCCEPVWEFRMMLLMAADHPLAREREIYYHMLGPYPEITGADLSAPPISLKHVRKGSVMEGPRRRLVVEDRGAQLDFLHLVKGSYLWTPTLPEDKLQKNGLVLRRCALPGMVYTDYFIYPALKAPDKLAKEFLRLLRERMKNRGVPPEMGVG